MRNVLRMVVRRRRSFGLGATLAACALLLAAPLVPATYTATAVLHLAREPADEAAVPDAAPPALADAAAIERAARDLGLLIGLGGSPAGQDLVARLAKDLEVTRDAFPDRREALTVRFTHRDPALAQALPNALAKNYASGLEQHRLQRLTEARDGLLKRTTDLKTSLADLTKRQIEFETRHAALPDSPGTLHQQIRDTRAKIEELRSRRAAALQQLVRLKSLDTPPPPSEEPREVVRGPNPALSALEQQLRQYQAELDQAVTIQNMTDDHPTVKQLRKKLEVLKRQIDETPKEAVLQRVYGPEPANSNLAVQLATTQSEVDMASMEIERLEKQLAEAQNALITYAPAREQYLGVLKQADEQQAELKRLQERLADAEVSLAAAQAGRLAAAVQLADRPLEPSYPRLWQVLGAAALGALVVGGGLAFLADRLDQTVRTPEEAAAAFQVPVCGVVSEIVGRPRRLLRAVGRWILKPAASLVLLAALTLATANAVLWLRFPARYPQWKADPAAFVCEQVLEWSRRARPAP